MNPTSSDTPAPENSKEQGSTGSVQSVSDLSDSADAGKISVGITVPNTSWSIRIQSIYRMDNKIWVFSELSSGGVGASVITNVEDSVTADLPQLPVRHYVWGKDWNWENTEDVTFIGYFDYYPLKLKAWWSGDRVKFQRRDSSQNYSGMH